MPIDWRILGAVVFVAGAIAMTAAATRGEPVAALSLDQQQARPFRHAAHRALSCGGCHPTGERHRMVRVWTPADCAACHHDPARAYPCANCHPAEVLPPAGRVPVTLSLTVWDSAAIRDLPFAHARHAAKSCQECHIPPAGAAARTECAACHTDHHRPEADCAQCHRPARPGAHGLAVHLTCAGSGCHERVAEPVPLRGVAMRPLLSRTLCLLCHPEQREHEPGGTCHVCHRIPATSP
jgi:hypothetical protein